MPRSNRLLLVLSCLLVACGDDAGVPSESDGTDTEGTTSSMTPNTTTIEPSSSSPSTTDPSTTDDTESETDPTEDTEDPTDTTSTTDDTESSSDGGPVCGNNLVDGDDECDGPDLDGESCATQEFDGGALSCADDCTFDVSGCTTCGDDAIEGDEACEGDDLDDETCESQGFVRGDLACADDCSFDTSGCDNCGNGTVDAGEDCDMDDLADTICEDLGMGFTGGVLACSDECGFDMTGCTNLPRPAVGEVVISEIMQNSSTVPDPDGEWFELYNPDVAVTYQLRGCSIEGNDSDNGFVIGVDLEIGPLSYLTFGNDSSDPGFTPSFSYPDGDLSLNNSSDAVELMCDAVSVDRVAYDDGATFPDPDGASMNLDPDALDATDNDAGINWCDAITSYNGDLGTPGGANDECPAAFAIDFCRLQFPETIDETEGTDVDVFGRVFISGLTDLTGMNDPSPAVSGEIGYGPDDTDPAVDGGWTWVPAASNAAYGPASPAYEANNDEYFGALNVPTPAGEYDFAFRFSGDSGGSFTYCDTGMGTADGYSADDAGQLTSTAAPVPNMFFSEYLEGASNDKALEIYNADSFEGDLDLCVINRYFNGDTDPSPIQLSGTIPAGGLFVLCHSSIADDTACDETTASANWNGDDALELLCGTTVLDIIGEIGLDPGAEWNVGGVGTQNEDLRRLCTVTAGDTDGSDAFDPSAEWETNDDGDLSNLGIFDCLEE